MSKDQFPAKLAHAQLPTLKVIIAQLRAAGHPTQSNTFVFNFFDTERKPLRCFPDFMPFICLIYDLLQII